MNFNDAITVLEQLSPEDQEKLYFYLGRKQQTPLISALEQEARLEQVEFWEEGESENAERPSVEEVLRSVEQHRWTPPPGSPSPSEILRQIRDQA
jgi:hypothetical protein